MIQGARYVRTSLIAQGWRRLSDFYQSVLRCVLVPPQRNFAGAELEAGTGFAYSQVTDRQAPAANRPGFGHIAFAVGSVADAREEVLRAGGKAVGEIVTLTASPGPEGDVVLRHRIPRGTS